ncbi:MAG: YkgJ family cysteine cluster protein [Methylococcaceae bacterium]|nr:YkgJ family cysteine cluster protein [Methylococcaceae bacterium]
MTEFLRRPTHHYQDPLARIWMDCAERIGFRIERTNLAYATTDGRGTIFIGADEMLDSDDSLAQMIFHELCHALVEGEAGETQADWGLGYSGGSHPWREHACLRLQAYLAGNMGLRGFFAPTTDYRVSFWNSLPEDPFAATAEDGGRRERSCVAARIAAWRAAQPRWNTPLRKALAASAAIAALTPRVLQAEAAALPASAADGRQEAGNPMPSLWETANQLPALHPTGHAPVAAYHAEHDCDDCAWTSFERNARRCQHAPGIRLADDAPACTRWEPASELDCLSCGACCREAYHSVEISAREPVNKRHPELVVVLDTHRKLRRDGDRCAALGGGDTPQQAYACTIYADRPRTCQEFTRGSNHCLDARRRVGLSL